MNDKWEYFFYSVRNSELQNISEDSTVLLAIPKLGDEGWELVDMAVYTHHTVFAFKRKKIEEVS